MLNKDRHQLLMGQILRDIYADISIAPLLGFKGGTCAYFFYDLPRFSVDLDFDLLKSEERIEKSVFEKIKNIAEAYGAVKDCYIKRNTIFALMSYGEEDRNIKIEISTRELPEIEKNYEIKEHLKDCIALVKKIKDSEILQGLGELVEEGKKDWIRRHLRREVVFLLNNYLSVIQ